MRSGEDWFCDTLDMPGCERNAASTFLCKIEGIEVALCRPCLAAWREQARTDAALALRCPRCAPKYLATRAGFTAQAEAHARPAPAAEPLTGILAQAVEAAMFAEGMLVNARLRVLKRLAADPAVLAIIVGAEGSERVKTSVMDYQASLGRYTEINAQQIIDMLDPEGMWRYATAGPSDASDPVAGVAS